MKIPWLWIASLVVPIVWGWLVARGLALVWPLSDDPYPRAADRPAPHPGGRSPLDFQI